MARNVSWSGTPGRRPGVNLPKLDRDQVRVSAKLPCDVGSRRKDMIPRQRSGKKAASPLDPLCILACDVHSTSRLGLRLSDERRKFRSGQIANQQMDMISKHRLGMHPNITPASSFKNGCDDGRHVILPNHWNTPVGMPSDVSVESTCLMHRNSKRITDPSRGGVDPWAMPRVLASQPFHHLSHLGTRKPSPHQERH